MSKTEDDKRQLKERISALENENRLLKERLAKAGVSYADIVEGLAGETRSDYKPNQGSRIKRIEIKIMYVWSLWRDYEKQVLR